MTIAEKLTAIKNWLGSGSINIFGLPMSGKDTVGVRLAEDLGAKFLSSGMIIRAAEAASNLHLTDNGTLVPTNFFYDTVLPYFERSDLKGSPLVLSSIGRWSGEEDQVMSVAKSSGHEIKAVIWLKLSEADVLARWESAAVLNDRGSRADDRDLTIFKKRLAEFASKTVPVLRHYHELGLLIPARADLFRGAVYEDVVNNLYEFALKD